MLNRPFEYVRSFGKTNYYYLELEDLPYKFLAAEMFETLIEHTPRFLRKPKQKEITIPFVVKTMPMNSLFLFLLANALNLSVYTYELDVNENKIDIYKTWSDSDIFDLQEAFKEFLKSVEGKSNYSVPKTIKNPVAKGYDKDNYSFFALEKNGSYARTYWLLRTTETGALHLVAVNEVGTEAKPITMSVDTMLLDREMLTHIMNDFKNGKLLPKDDVEIKLEKEND